MELGVGGGDLDPGELILAAHQNGQSVPADLLHRERVTDQDLAGTAGGEEIDSIPRLEGRRLGHRQGDLDAGRPGFEVIGAKEVARLKGQGESGVGWNRPRSLVVEVPRAKPQGDGLDVGGAEHSTFVNGRA
jgi:hypothetical protein